MFEKYSTYFTSLAKELVPINPPSLGSNGLHCVEFLGERRKRLLNLNLGELPALLEMSCCLVCGRL